jgi:hypothetical protein
MASLNFPPNPNTGDRWTVGTKTYQWSGSAWLVATQNSVTSNIAVITSTTNATSTSTGALVIAGGVGIAKDLWIGGTIYSGSVPVLTTSSLGGSVFGGTDINITTVSTSSTTYLRFDSTSTLQTVTGRGNSTTNIVNITNTTESTSTTSGALIVAGGIASGKRINCESLKIADSVFDSSLITVNNTASTVIDSYLSTDFRSAKYFIQIGSGGGTNNAGTTATFQAVELLLVADNNNAVYATEYGLVVTGGASAGGGLGSFSADLSAIDKYVRLYFAATTATNKTIKVLRTGMAA